jgi:hypothetical protein
MEKLQKIFKALHVEADAIHELSNKIEKEKRA